MKKVFKTIVLAALLLLRALGPALGQDTGHDHSAEAQTSGHDEHAAFQAHKLALLTGYGFLSGAINEDGTEGSQIVPVLGLVYEYWFNHRIGVGSHNEIELTSYTVELDDQTYVERSYAVVLSAVFLYEPLHNWTLYAGPGYEIETHHNFLVIKIGTDITKSFEDGWAVGVVLSYDIKEVNGAVALGIAVSKRFGK